jgi:hypothetical protein
MAKKANKTQDINTRFDSIVATTKDVTKAANDFVLESTDDVLKVALKRTSDWQTVGEKALQGGLKLAANQQELMFDTLDVLKSQIKNGQKRFSALISNN